MQGTQHGSTFDVTLLTIRTDDMMDYLKAPAFQFAAIPDPFDELGRDFSALPDLSLSVQSGARNLAEALARRLITPRGGLFYDPSYGTDIREFINSEDDDETRFEMTTRISAEIDKDERVLSSSVEIGENISNSVTVTARIIAATGPFTLILTVDALGVTQLRANLE